MSVVRRGSRILFVVGRLRPGGEAGILDDARSGSDWLTIPYRCNRGFVFDGDLPHLSSPVESIVEGELRVILGFNCFTSEVGECCLRAPEHSDAFNRTIKMYQSMAALGMSMSAEDGSCETSSSAVDSDSKYGGPTTAKVSDHTTNQSMDQSAETKTKANPKRLTIQDVKNNPFLKKLVLAAAKAKKASQTS